MKKLLLYLLLVANLCAGSAFAWDTHAEAATGCGVVVDWTDADNHNDLDENSHHGDHCCHGGAHLTGVFYVTATAAALNPSIQRAATWVQTPPSLYIAPLLRPPIL